MSALVLDAGAFIAVDRNDRSMIARLRVAQLRGHELRTSAIVIAQVWRSPGGKQAGVARLLRAVDVRPVDEKMGRDAGALLAKARTDDPIDATVVLVARSGDRILTSDPDDIGRLASSSAVVRGPQSESDAAAGTASGYSGPLSSALVRRHRAPPNCS